MATSTPNRAPEPRAEIFFALEQRLGSKVPVGIESMVMERARELVAEGWAESLIALAVRLLHAAPDDPLVRKMLDAACIGETYFFRCADQLRAMADLVERHVVAPKRARGLRLLKVWSAACATGEEAYTLAALLRERFPDFALQVTGTDVNPSALEVARRGLYRGRSLREMAPEQCAWLAPRDGGWAVDDELRRLVGFAALNLVTEPLPSPERGLFDFDLVVCRNVLIYIDPAKVPAVMAKVSACAAARAVLMVASAEYSAAAHASGFSVAGPGLLARCKEPSGVVRREAPSVPVLSDEQAHAGSEARGEGRGRRDEGEALLCEARAAADRGALEEACRLGLLAIARAPDAPTPCYWTGAFHAARGDDEAAISYFTRALFLDRSLSAADLALGQALSRRGDAPQSRRHFLRALRLLEGAPEGVLIEELGVPVGVARRLAEDGLVGEGP